MAELSIQIKIANDSFELRDRETIRQELGRMLDEIRDTVADHARPFDGILGPVPVWTGGPEDRGFKCGSWKLDFLKSTK